VPDVTAWAIHPGGPRVVDAVADTLGLEPGSTEPSYDVLARYGNCSSATVLLVLQEILARRRPGPGEPLVMLAFGPGLTLYSALLRQG
jgi:alkylresorcinol/alkylpyrone synthase